MFAEVIPEVLQDEGSDQYIPEHQDIQMVFAREYGDAIPYAMQHEQFLLDVIQGGVPGKEINKDVDGQTERTERMNLKDAQ